MIKLRVFVSSVQKELAEERRAIKTLIASDPFLDEHCVPILYEDEPSMLKPAHQGYLNDLAKCQIYLAIIGAEYGKRYRGLSAVHHEYHFAQKKEMPVLVCVRGDSRVQRDPATDDFIAEIKADGHKYYRSNDLRELQQVVLKCLTRHVCDTYHIAPSLNDSEAALRTVATASRFDQARFAIRPDDKKPTLVKWSDLDHDIARQLAAKSVDDPTISLKDADIKEALLRRGLLWLSPETKEVFCSPAGVLLCAKDPTMVYPQSCIRLLAFQGKERDAMMSDFMDINAPISKALDLALQFIDKNTRHPLRVVGIHRLRLDEYPVTALREAVINAMAHRDYEDASRKIHIELFKDRIEVISPGLLPGGITLAQMRSGKVHPCSRNPVLAQGLRLLGLMEEMGTGVRRMKQAMLDNGLDSPEYSMTDYCFMVTFRGPGSNVERLRVPESTDWGIAPSIEEQLNDRQKKMLRLLARDNHLTNRQCQRLFSVSGPTVAGDFKLFQKLHIVKQMGRGRSVFYVLDTDTNR